MSERASTTLSRLTKQGMKQQADRAHHDTSLQSLSQHVPLWQRILDSGLSSGEETWLPSQTCSLDLLDGESPKHPSFHASWNPQHADTL